MVRRNAFPRNVLQLWMTEGPLQIFTFASCMFFSILKHMEPKEGNHYCISLRTSLTHSTFNHFRIMKMACYSDSSAMSCRYRVWCGFDTLYTQNFVDLLGTFLIYWNLTLWDSANFWCASIWRQPRSCFEPDQMQKCHNKCLSSKPTLVLPHATHSLTRI